MAAHVSLRNLNPADHRAAELVFEFVQFLLDEDANLTPAGNLTGTARQKFRARLQEILAAEETAGGAAPAGSSETVAPAEETP